MIAYIHYTAEYLFDVSEKKSQEIILKTSDVTSQPETTQGYGNRLAGYKTIPPEAAWFSIELITWGENPPMFPGVDGGGSVGLFPGVIQ